MPSRRGNPTMPGSRGPSINGGFVQVTLDMPTLPVFRDRRLPISVVGTRDSVHRSTLNGSDGTRRQTLPEQASALEVTSVQLRLEPTSLRLKAEPLVAPPPSTLNGSDGTRRQTLPEQASALEVTSVQLRLEPTSLRLTAEPLVAASRCKHEAYTREITIIPLIGGTLGGLRVPGATWPFGRLPNYSTSSGEISPSDLEFGFQPDYPAVSCDWLATMAELIPIGWLCCDRPRGTHPARNENGWTPS